MRLTGIFLFAAALLVITGCQTGPSETDKQIVKNLEEISKKLSAIDKQLKEIQEDVEIKAPSVRNQPSFVRRGPNMKKLNKIKLPANPTSQQVEKYISEIISASQGQNSFSTTDLQVSMLSRIDSKYTNLLLNHLNNFHVAYALPNIVTEKNKKEILEAFKSNPRLIDCVMKKGWTKDAKDTIIAHLENTPPATLSPHNWGVAAVQVVPPEKYDVLENYFASCPNPQMIFNSLANLEKFNIKRAVDRAWKRQKTNPSEYTKKQMSMIAARYGHKDALAYLINAYRRETNQYYSGQMINTLFLLTGKDLSPKEMLEWYNKNKDKLVFDPKNEEYVIKEPAKTKSK
jgi:hypothetical protein